MKKLLSTAVALMFVASMAFAQGPIVKPAANTAPTSKKECTTKKTCCSHGEKKASRVKKSEASTTLKTAPASTVTGTTQVKK